MKSLFMWYVCMLYTSVSCDMNVYFHFVTRLVASFINKLDVSAEHNKWNINMLEEQNCSTEISLRQIVHKLYKLHRLDEYISYWN